MKANSFVKKILIVMVVIFMLNPTSFYANADAVPHKTAGFVWKKEVLTIYFKNKNNVYTEMVMKKSGINKLFGIQKLVYYSDTKELEASLKVYTDFIGPYKVKSLETSQMSQSKFTGGWHGSNGDSSGNATGITEIINVLQDGKILESGSTGAFETLTIVVKNNIKPYNSSTDYALSELIEYTIHKEGDIQISNKITAQKNIEIEKYYGLQSQNFRYYSKIIYEDEQDTALKASKAFEYSEANNCRKIVFIGKSRKWIMTLYNEGLGEFKYNNTNCTAFTEDYGKTYFNLINNKTLYLKKGETAYWKGSYQIK